MVKNAFAIPAELRALRQWILWRYEDKGGPKPTKIPYSVRHQLASVTDPSSWSSFEEVHNLFQMGNYSGIGFVFTENDPYAFIDLDDTEGNKTNLERQQLIFKEFDSYSERSPSGKGLHIIVKGSIPQGRKRASVEVYSSVRYATMTGDVFHDVAIANRHEMLNDLFSQMGGKPIITTHTGNAKEIYNDQQIIEQASNASNGDKFLQLFSGDWSQLYPTQSEADFAIIDIITFYTQNKHQIERIFRLSQLGKRDKANRKDYLEWMIRKSFDKLPPEMDFDGFRVALEEKIRQSEIDKAGSVNGKPSPFDGETIGSSPIPAANNGSVAQRLVPTAHNGSYAGSSPAASTITPPPGLLGAIAHFIYNAAPRPVPEMALAGAIGLMAGICGRAYNVSGTGLNQYILLLANTGTGKEAMASGIDKIINAVSMQVPVAPEFIGPSEIASGQALVKYLSNKSQSFVSILGEFGLRMQSMCDPRANGAEKSLKRMLLDLYNKSGHGQNARPSIYADIEKNTNLIASPAFSILGESTPETFYSALSEEMIAEGLLPRFMLVEYNGPRPKLNPNHLHAKAPEQLINNVATLISNAKTVMHNRSVTNVHISYEAKAILHDFDKLADNKIDNTDKEVVRQLWNRAHIKLLKISALVAVGINPFQPTISVENVIWAKQMVEHDIKTLSDRFAAGTVGKNSDEIKQYILFKKHVIEFATTEWSKIKAYCGPTEQILHSNKYTPMSFMNNKIGKLSSFRNDKNGGNLAVKRCISIGLSEGFIVQVSRQELIKLGKTATCYMISDSSQLNVD